MLFFEAEVVAVVKAPNRPEADTHAALPELRADLFERDVGLGLDQLQQPVGMAIQQSAAMAAYGVWRNALLTSPPLHPFDRRALADPENLGRRTGRDPAFHVANQTDTQILGISPRHQRSPNQMRSEESPNTPPLGIPRRVSSFRKDSKPHRNASLIDGSSISTASKA